MGSMSLSGGFHEPVCPWVHGTLARGFMEHRGWGSLGPLIPSRPQYSCPIAPSIVASADYVCSGLVIHTGQYFCMRKKLPTELTCVMCKPINPSRRRSGKVIRVHSWPSNLDGRGCCFKIRLSVIVCLIYKQNP